MRENGVSLQLADSIERSKQPPLNHEVDPLCPRKRRRTGALQDAARHTSPGGLRILLLSRVWHELKTCMAYDPTPDPTRWRLLWLFSTGASPE